MADDADIVNITNMTENKINCIISIVSKGYYDLIDSVQEDGNT